MDIWFENHILGLCLCIIVKLNFRLCLQMKIWNTVIPLLLTMFSVPLLSS